MRLWWIGLVAVAAAACGTGDETAGSPASSGASSGGGVGVAPSEPPGCLDPNLPSGPIPTARADSAAAITDDGRELLLFGGDEAIVVCGDTPQREHVADTWLLDVGCGRWEQLAIEGPGPRARHVLIEDASRGRALLFGGRYREPGKTGNYTLFNDVWAFDRSARTWAELATKGPAPTPRANTAAVVDGDKLLVFGGTTSPSGLNFTPTNDLYALDLTTNEWSKLDATGELPEKRLFHAMAVDPRSHKSYVAFGGDQNAFVGPFFKDLYELDNETVTWKKLQTSYPSGHDFGRIKFGLSVRSADAGQNAQLFAFGGHDDVNGAGALGNRNDLLGAEIGSNVNDAAWEARLSGDTFNAPANGQCDFPADFVVPDAGNVERRSAFAFAALPSGEAFVVFGGDSDCGRLSDAWWFDTRKLLFTPLFESLPGLTCPRTGNPDCKSLCG